MRAIYCRDNSIEEMMELSDDRAQHLIKVCRIKKGETVAFLDGNGTKSLASVIEVSKRSISFELINKTHQEDNRNIDLLLGLAKRESFEQSIKNAVEIGIKDIYPFESKFHTWQIKKRDRLEAIVESAMIQSNNPFKTNIQSEVSFSDLDNVVDKYDYVVLATLKNIEDNYPVLDKSKKYLLVIGPEGGLSEDEEAYFFKLKNSLALRVPTFILRAPNAVSVLSGYLHGKFDAL